jgi:hypothetical protein
MMPWLAAGFLVLGFVALARLLRMIERSTEVFAISRRSFDVIRDSSLSDDDKEATLQRNALQLFRLFFLLTLAGLAAVFLPLGLVWCADRLAWISLQEVMDVALSPIFLIGSGVLALLAFWTTPTKSRETDGYSSLDRLLHRVAFNTYSAQAALADLEDTVFSRKLADCRLDRPVFITGLPRAGTTLLLECLARMPEFATHCYRDMPFVLTPCLWSRFSARFRKSGEKRERAHGDGMLIDFDSPEALEEVLWKTFWKRHYEKNRVVPWGEENDSEFTDFFYAHLRKIILLRRETGASRSRYASKNNLNIARTPMLRRLCPDAVLLVPFREPLQHAASLLRQHRNFLRIHRENRFASEYMRAIGHFDFGENLRPVDFDGWLARRRTQDADDLAFWLEYWVACYRHLLERTDDSLCLLSYQALCKHPERELRRIAETIGCHDAGPLLSAAEGIRPPRPHEADTGSIATSLLEEAGTLYSRLEETAAAPWPRSAGHSNAPHSPSTRRPLEDTRTASNELSR